jgi:hypothetical protein
VDPITDELVAYLESRIELATRAIGAPGAVPAAARAELLTLVQVRRRIGELQGQAADAAAAELVAEADCIGPVGHRGACIDRTDATGRTQTWDALHADAFAADPAGSYMAARIVGLARIP